MKTVSSLIHELRKYKNINEEPVRNNATGVEVTPKIIEDMLRAYPDGEKQLQLFIKERILSPKVDFFAHFKRVNPITVLENKKKKLKAIEII